MNRAAWFAPCAVVTLISNFAFGQTNKPPASEPAPEPSANAPASNQPVPPTNNGTTVQAPPAPATANEPKPVAVEFTSLRLLRDKGIISQAEYDSAVADIEASAGQRGPQGGTVAVGKWATTIYGFVEADAIYDSTESFNESAGNAQIAKGGTYPGDNNRLMFSIRNTRLGIRSAAPEYAGLRASAQLEMDFLGTQLPVGSGQPYFGSEQAYFSNPTFRARHANIKLETPIVDFLFGQYWQLFGWQSNFHPNTVEIQGVPGQLYSRTVQLRISKTVKTEIANLELAIAAMRPPQRDSATPEGEAGARLMINHWKGVHTTGATGTSVVPMSIGVSGDARYVRLPEFLPTPVNSKSHAGAAVALSMLVPVIPGDTDSMGNSLTLVGEYANGFGIEDMYTGLTGGASFPTLPNPTNAVPAPTYTANIDPGIAVFDSTGGVHLVQWISYLVGAEYYLPGLHGRVWVSANYSHMQSPNLTQFGTAAKERSALDWMDGNLFADITPAVRLGLEFANFRDSYGDGTHATNNRIQFSGFYIF